MFAAPPEVTANVFATLPSELAGDVSRSYWLQQQHKGRPLPAFLEGPSFDREGNLYCVDVAYGRIFRINPQGEFTLAAQYDGEPNGLKIHQDGRIFIADYRHGIMVLDPHNGKVEPYFTRPMFERFRGVNDLHFASNGDLYFTDQGQSGLQSPNGRVFRLRAGGQLDCLLDNVPSPNGLTFNASETDLLLAVTRANAVWRVRFPPDRHTVAKSGTFIQLSGGLAGPDGLAIDEEDNLLVCHMGMGSVWKFNRLGEPVLRIRSPRGILTSNCAFGGPGRKTLFITDSETASILSVPMDTAGKKTYALT
ncbi:SMP-30/gluconolactonase/LRE family protein [Allopusillimonas soli]|uniref:SMP-30/gluconolactonase/LRE family protein n=1 Tax=Allopusillimonas soli TaxID=659016 RepID=A0A853FF54_9BURK|nr:SMP-30/gluconolactonase/LRE family protein [Allopusillimonas soli]NYT37450.1 SMP-30/gluconolactonase/LRE family protein [Allopusillimonas soli]TEA74569.1 SMP-30/gluconolactonase/LRE family protein [Allopusillimonas soli]